VSTYTSRHSCHDVFSHLYCVVLLIPLSFLLFFFSDTAPTEIYTLSLHDALPISLQPIGLSTNCVISHFAVKLLLLSSCSGLVERSEEHTSELQSRFDLVCRLLLEKKKIQNDKQMRQSNDTASRLVRQWTTTAT